MSGIFNRLSSASELSNGVTGSGAVVLANTPILITPELGIATAGRLTVTTSSAGTGLVINNSGGTVSPALLLQSGGVSGVTIGYVRSANDFIAGSLAGDLFLGAVTGTQRFLFASSGFLRAEFNTSGHFIPGLTNTYSLGISGTEWSDVRSVLLTITGAATLSSTLGVTGKITCGAAVFLKVFTVATLPAAVAGDTAFASDLRVSGEGAGAGTGGIASYNGTAWKVAGTNTTAVA